MENAVISQQPKAKDSLKQAEQELAKFAASIDGKLRTHFANRTLQKMLTLPNQDKNGNVNNELNLLAPSRIGLVIVAVTWWLIYSSVAKWNIPLSGWAALLAGIGAAFLYETKLAPKIFFAGYRFRLMRLDQHLVEGEYPAQYIVARIEESPSGFGLEYWKQSRVEQGHLVVSVGTRKNSGQAIIHLRTEGKLAVTSWQRDLYKENLLPPLPNEIKELALAFDKECDKYAKTAQKLESSRTLKSKKDVPIQRDLNEIWKSVAIAPELRERLMSLATHFAEGSAAASRGLLLYGPPGTGKTLIAKNLAESMGCAFFPLSLPDLKSGYIGQSGAKVKEIWQKALAEPRAVIFVDECEGVFGRRGSVNTDSFAEEIVQAFLAEWDGFSKQTTVWVVGATNRRDLIDPAVISRFGEEVEIGLPGDQQRIAILKTQLVQKGVQGELPSRVSEVTQGLSGRELETLAGRLAREQSNTPITNELLEKYTEGFRKQGSTTADVNAVWDNLILSEQTLKDLKTTAGLLQHAETFTKRGIGVPRGLLLYGPPGTGKTQIARTLANETGLRFIAASTADIKAGYIGQSGQKVRELFERARESSPSLLFIDEIDIVAPVRGNGGDQFTQEIIGQFLQEMDGVKAQAQTVFVLAATNRVDQIDAALLSRFTKQVEIPLPDESSRKQLLKVMLKSKPIGFEIGEGVALLAAKTSGMSGRDLRNLIDHAEQSAVGRAIEAGNPELATIYLEDFPKALLNETVNS